MASEQTAGERREAGLQRFLAERAAGGGVVSAKLVREETRPFSELGWYEFGDGDKNTVVVKASRQVRARGSGRPTEAENARRIGEVFTGSAELGVVAPLAEYKDLSVTITQAMNGGPVSRLIEESARWTPGPVALARLQLACSLAGRWLSTLHRARPARESWDAEALCEDVDNRMRRLVALPRAVGMSPGLRSRALDWMGGRLAEAGPADLAGSLTHGDFSPSNMLFDGRRLLVLDFTMVREAPRLLDVTRFCHQIDLLRVKPAYRAATRSAMRRTFLEAYADSRLTGSPLGWVFLLRHSLTHWLSRATLIGKKGVATAFPSLWLCWHHRRHVGWLLRRQEGTPWGGGQG